MMAQLQLQLDLVRGHAGSTMPVAHAASVAPMAAEFGVQGIPAVMHKSLHWRLSAAVMALWFSKPARVMSAAEKQDGSQGATFPTAFVATRLFTMQWLLSFQRTEAGLQPLTSTLNTANARKVLASISKALPDGAGSAGSLSVANLHAQRQVQFVQIGYAGEMDDLSGSLGKFGLYAAMLDWKVTGALAPGQRQLQISRVGIDMRDTFDFIGGQYLGHSNRQGMGMVAGTMVAGSVVAGSVVAETEWHLPAWNPSMGWMTPINNGDFNAWRTRHKAGGDLLLFSDVMLHPVDIRLPL